MEKKGQRCCYFIPGRSQVWDLGLPGVIPQRDLLGFSCSRFNPGRGGREGMGLGWKAPAWRVQTDPKSSWDVSFPCSALGAHSISSKALKFPYFTFSSQSQPGNSKIFGTVAVFVSRVVAVNGTSCNSPGGRATLPARQPGLILSHPLCGAEQLQGLGKGGQEPKNPHPAPPRFGDLRDAKILVLQELEI